MTNKHSHQLHIKSNAVIRSCDCGQPYTPEALQEQVVELVLADGARDAEQEGLAEQRRAGVVEARLLVFLPQMNRNHHVIRVLLPADGQLKPAPHGHGYQKHALTSQ